MEDMIRWLFGISFEFLGFEVDFSNFLKTIYDFCDWTKIQNTDFWSIAESINTLMVPIGLSILTIFAMVELTKEALNVENISWQKIVMKMIKFFMIKFFISNSFYLSSQIMQICQDSFNAAFEIAKVTASTDLAESLVALLDGNIFENLIMMVIIIILYIPFIGTIVGILVQVITRVGKITIGFSCAPVPIALGASEDGRNTCKSFLLWIAALGFESIIIIICAKIYATSLNSISEANEISKMIAIMVANGLFMALVSLGSTLAEKFTASN